MAELTSFEKSILHEHFQAQADYYGAKTRAENGEPLAYIIGEWYFYGLTFKLNRECLIPRPDTEHIVEKAISFLPENGRFADLCTGSGCIALSVLANRPDLTAFALDISQGALDAARENAELLKVNERIAFTQADVLAAPTLQKEYFDAIISNPPYISSSVLAELDVAKTEPVLALDGGSDGLLFYRHIIKNYAYALKKDGAFIFEIGYDQANELRALADENAFSCEIIKDYGGNDRVAFLKNQLHQKGLS